MQVSLEDIKRIVGLKVTFGEPNGYCLEGIVVPPPEKEHKAEYCVLHRPMSTEFDHPTYFNLDPKKIKSIKLTTDIDVIIVMPLPQPEYYYDKREAYIADTILKQHGM